MWHRFRAGLRSHLSEQGLVIVMASLLLGNSLTRQVTGIVAVSGVLSESGANQMLLVLAIDYLVILLTGGLQSLIVDRFGRVGLIGGLSLVFALVFLVSRLLFVLHVPAWLNYTLLYMVGEQQLIFFPLVFWVLANDIFDMSRAKRLFPLIASWSFVGKVAGSGLAGLAPVLLRRMHAADEDVLLLNAALYLLMALLVFLTLRNTAARAPARRQEKLSETVTAGWVFVREVPLFRYLALAVVLLAVCDTIVEFRFLVITGDIFSSHVRYQQFYSMYRLGVTVVSFAVQTLLTGRLIERLGLQKTLFFFPAVALGGSLGLVFFPGLAAAVAAMTTLKLTRETVDDSSRKVLQGLVPEERRGRVGTFIDNYLSAGGTILACLVTGGIVLAGQHWQVPWYPVLYLGFAAAAGLAALWATVQMRRVYDSSLLHWRLKRRQRTSKVLGKLDLEGL